MLRFLRAPASAFGFVRLASAGQKFNFYQL